MISIVNIGPFDDPDSEGWRNYELRINQDVICTFCHKRSYGLAACLRKAADKIEELEREPDRRNMK